MSLKNIIIASTSTVHGSDFLDYLLKDLKTLFENTNEIVFIPFARPGGLTHELYTEKVKVAFKKIGISVKGLHEFSDPIHAVENAKGIFVGGGNTFVLVNQLYKNNLISAIQNAVISGTPYLGTSAGSNICGLTMHTTNDMPIVYPPSFKTLGLVPFNINPHYLDPIPDSKHMGETRETRIKEFHKFNTQPVVGLREGSFLRVIGDDIVLKGPHAARVFEYNKIPHEIESGTNLNALK
ncbi:MAG: dipeptidase PepE [Bacteroidetes bacterium]|nr:MAG: dipeptidase PepE [Bacteroidota bacterium]